MSNRNITDFGNQRFQHWFLRCYGISIQNEYPQVYQEKIIALIKDAEQFFSTEYIYKHIGFSFHHIGRRGEVLSLWHWGLWEDTIELFNHAIYRYNDSDQFETLTLGEPILSLYDLEIVSKEFKRVGEIAHGDIAKLISNYNC